MTDDLIDQAALHRLLSAIGGDPKDLEELIEDFADIGPALVLSLRSDCEAKDWDNVRITAHTLKSNGREFGAMALSNLCQTLEQQCVDNNVVHPEAQIVQIENELLAAIEALDLLRTGGA